MDDFPVVAAAVAPDGRESPPPHRPPRFHLCQELHGHAMDVRGLCCLPAAPPPPPATATATVAIEDQAQATAFASCSRDRTVRLWKFSRRPPPAGGGSPCSSAVMEVEEVEKTTIYYCDQVFTDAHSHYVAAVCPAVSASDVLLLASAGYDKLVNCWKWGDYSQPPAASASASADAMDISGGAAAAEPVTTLIGHEKEVVSLASSPSGVIISGSADETARLWLAGSCTAVLKHTGIVWAVLHLPCTDEFVTGSSDCHIRLWKNNVVVKQVKCTDYVRCLVLLPDCGFVSAGNDGILRLWSFDLLLQREMYGHTSFVYSLSLMPSGEILSVGEDRMLRIWNHHTAETVQAISHPGTLWSVAGLSNGDIATGCSDGIIRVWSRNPARIADVDSRQAYNTVIETQQLATGSVGDIPLDKLPDLSALIHPGKSDGHIQCVRNGKKAEAYSWNESNSQWNLIGEVVDAKGGETASGYKSGTLNGKFYDFVFEIEMDDGTKYSLGHKKGENPYWSAKSFLDDNELDLGYLDQVAQFIIKNAETSFLIGEIPSSTILDPLTKAKPIIPSQFSDLNHIPHKSTFRFSSTNLDGLLKKVTDFNTIMSNCSDSSVRRLSMSDLEMITFKSQVLALKSPEESMQYRHSFWELFFLKLRFWSGDHLLPVIDVIRILIANPRADDLIGKCLCKDSWSVFDFLKPYLSPSCSIPVLSCVSLRLIANMFLHPILVSSLIARETFLLDFCEIFFKHGQGNCKKAAVAILLNMSIHFDSKCASRMTLILIRLIRNEDDNDILEKAVLALGTTFLRFSETLKMGKSSELRDRLCKINSVEFSDQVREASGEVLTVLIR